METPGAGEATGHKLEIPDLYVHQVVATVKSDFPTVMKFYRKLTPLERISRFCQGNILARKHARPPRRGVVGRVTTFPRHRRALFDIIICGLVLRSSKRRRG